MYTLDSKHQSSEYILLTHMNCKRCQLFVIKLHEKGIGFAW